MDETKKLVTERPPQTVHENYAKKPILNAIEKAKRSKTSNVWINEMPSWSINGLENGKVVSIRYDFRNSNISLRVRKSCIWSSIKIILTIQRIRF